MAVDIEAIKAKLKALNSYGSASTTSSMNLWYPEVGEYTIRCIPWSDAPDGQPYHEFSFYYFGKYKMLARSQFGHSDPIKECRDKLFSTKKDDDKQLAKKLLAKTRAYILVLVRGKESEGIKVWSVGKEIHSRLLNFFLDSEIGDYTDLNSGFDLKVTVKKLPGKKYNDTAVDVARKPSKAFGDLTKLEELKKNVPNLRNVYKEKTYEECKRDLDTWLSEGAPSDGDAGTEHNAPETTVTQAKSDKPATKSTETTKSNTDQKLDDLETLFASVNNS